MVNLVVMDEWKEMVDMIKNLGVWKPLGILWREGKSKNNPQ
jgi:hypothetical protein